MRNEVKMLREAVKEAGINAREYKQWYRRRQSAAAKGGSFIDPADPDPAKVENPSRRATLLCMAISHARGRLHAPGYCYPAYGHVATNDPESQRQHLEKSLDKMAEWEAWYGANYQKYGWPEKKASLSADERKAIRIILHEMSRPQEEAQVSAAG